MSRESIYSLTKDGPSQHQQAINMASNQCTEAMPLVNVWFCSEAIYTHTFGNVYDNRISYMKRIHTQCNLNNVLHTVAFVNLLCKPLNSLLHSHTEDKKTGLSVGTKTPMTTPARKPTMSQVLKSDHGHILYPLNIKRKTKIVAQNNDFVKLFLFYYVKLTLSHLIIRLETSSLKL